jgi:hypothetical protein
LKPERWGSPLVQEKYWENKVCDGGAQHSSNYDDDNDDDDDHTDGANVKVQNIFHGAT